jgi:4a-hydroxytetrahydrobiopterin dehydratase
MNQISSEKCESFGVTDRKLDYTEIVALLQQLPSWKLVSKAGMDFLQKTYTFNNFSHALAFTLRIGKLADDMDHHPAILTEWGKTTVSWWTQRVNGLQPKDFIMSARTDDLYE